MDEKIILILNEMSEYLSITQMKKLQEVIIKTFADNEACKIEISNEEFLKMFLDAKRIEGCSERTIIYYQAILNPLYVAYFMESTAGKEQFESKNQSAVKAGLNFNSINSLRIMVPPISIQEEFVSFVKQVDKSKVVV